MPDSRPSNPGALRYQEQRGLDDVPAYATGVQLRLADGTRTYVALSATELALYFADDRAFHYDLNGRLIKTVTRSEFWRRSLSGKYLHTRKLTTEEGGGVVREVVDADTGQSLLNEARQRTAVAHAALRDGTGTVELIRTAEEDAVAKLQAPLERAANFDQSESDRDAARFRAIYGRVAVLPPDQYNALVLQATIGCAYSGCAFCELYKDVPFRRKSAEEFRQHIRDAIEFHGDSLRARRSIFLGEANALTQPVSVIKEQLEVIHANFELPDPETPTGAVGANWWLGQKLRFDSICSFLDAFTNVHRSVEDYHDLRRSGLRRVYIGLETGAPELLQWLKKPATPEAVVHCVRLLRQANIQVGVIILLGAGGQENAKRHVGETVSVINEMGLGRGDYVYFSPLVIYPGSQYDTQAMADAITPLTAEEMRAQEEALRLGLRFASQQGKPYLARYELETFVY